MDPVPTETVFTAVANVLSPVDALKRASRAHPAFKYSLVVLGLFAIIVIALKWGASPFTLAVPGNCFGGLGQRRRSASMPAAA